MAAVELFCSNLNSHEHSCSPILFNSNLDFSSFVGGGLFLEPSIPDSFARLIPSRNSSIITSDSISSTCCRQKPAPVSGVFRRGRRVHASVGGGFLSVSLRDSGFVGERKTYLVENGDEGSDKGATCEGGNADSKQVKKQKVRVRGGRAMNTSKHLWAGAVAAMVSRTFVAPLERLKLEYILRGEQKSLFDLINTIASSQGLGGFWKGNLVNILRTAPFKAINFYAYDTYRKQLLRLSGSEETTNFERFVAGAAARMTATILCLPLDTTHYFTHG